MVKILLNNIQLYMDVTGDVTDERVLEMFLAVNSNSAEFHDFVWFVWTGADNQTIQFDLHATKEDT